MASTYITAAEAVACVQSGHRVFIHGSAATPVPLVNALLDRYETLRNVELVGITNMGGINFNTPEFKKSFYFNSLFVSENRSEARRAGRGWRARDASVAAMEQWMKAV